jgi:uncharacterized membrane protein YkvA (DUF1232 family)
MALSLVSAARYVAQFPKTAMLAARLFMDARVPSLLKVGTIAAALVVISPADLLGDIPLLGPIDDLAMLILLVNLFVRFSPAGIVDEHRGVVGADPAAAAKAADLKNVTPR